MAQITKKINSNGLLSCGKTTEKPIALSTRFVTVTILAITENTTAPKDCFFAS